MPFIHVQTNTAITDEQAKNIKTHLGLAITAVPGKASSNALNTLTSNITGILLDTLKIPTDRIYVSYMCTENWGWNSSNF